MVIVSILCADKSESINIGAQNQSKHGDAQHVIKEE